MKKEDVIETASAIALFALLAFLCKLWFVAEGFTIDW